MLALLLLATTVLAQILPADLSAPPMQCVGNCVNFSVIFSECQWDSYQGMAKCFQRYCSPGPSRSALSACLECMAEADGKPVAEYWAGIDDMCAEMDTDAEMSAFASVDSALASVAATASRSGAAAPGPSAVASPAAGSGARTLAAPLVPVLAGAVAALVLYYLA